MTTASISSNPVAVAPAWMSRIASIVILVSRWVLGFVFISSSVPKLVYPDLFFDSILEYGLFGDSVAYLGAIAVPSLELVLGLALLLGVSVVPAMAYVTALMLFFTGLHGWVVLSGTEAACGCFSVGAADAPISWLSVGRNALLLALAVGGLVLSLQAARRHPHGDPTCQKGGG